MAHSPFVFLLGGHDLEMIEIKNILLSNEVPFFDKELKCNNALLSQYVQELNNRNFLVGVELQTDIEPPEQYLLIDHHNRYAGKPSAIEQVARLLDIELTYDQKLVAANDIGDITAMLEMGAMPEEIADIRRRDKEAQGVTGEGERLLIQMVLSDIKNVFSV